MEKDNPIKKVLDQLNITQDKLAATLDVTRQTLQNFMKDTDKIPAGIILRLSQISGISVDNLLPHELYVEGPQLPEEYETGSRFISAFGEDAKEYIAEMDNLDSGGSELFEQKREDAKNDIGNIVKNVKRIGRKATVCCFGKSDSGKSTLLNFILGKELLPAKYNPLTATPVYIHHIDDKPGYMNAVEDSVVYGRKKNDEKDEPRFSHNVTDIYDKDAVEKYIVRKGDHSSIIDGFSTHEGYYNENKDFDYTIDEIHVWVDIDILKEITLVDIPGFGTGKTSDDVGLTMNMAEFDLIIYMSPSIGFLNNDDIAALTQILCFKKGFEADGEKIIPVIVCATHSNAVGDPQAVKTICDSGAERMWSIISEDHKDIFGNSFEAFREHFIGLEVSNDIYMNVFKSKFVGIVRAVNSYNLGTAREYLGKVAENCRNAYDNLKNKMISPCLKSFSEDERDEAIRELKKKCYCMKKEMDAETVSRKKASKDAYCLACREILNEEYLIGKMENMKLKNKKGDLEAFANYVTNEINSKLTKILESESKMFTDKLTEGLDSFKASADLQIDMSSFNVKTAFISGLVGVSTYGALAAWAAAVAAGSNLGAYVLIAKIVSVLSAMGISLGGTAAVISAISSIGGPVTLGIILAVLTAISAFGIISGTWKKIFAKKLIKTFEEEGNVYEKGNESIEKYWNDTANAFEKCNAKLLEESIEYVNREYERINLESEERGKLTERLAKLYRRSEMFYASYCNG